jgi:hypothetical protein
MENVAHSSTNNQGNFDNAAANIDKSHILGYQPNERDARSQLEEHQKTRK